MYKLIFLAILAFISAAALNFKINSFVKPEEKALYVPPPKFAEHLAFGYDESFADSLWLRVIQDFAVCQEKHEQSKLDIIKPVESLSTEEDPILDEKIAHVVKEVSRANQGRKVCRKGWVYRMLDAVTELAPEFKVPYTVGAISLSVLIDDYEGASALFEKGFKQFPNNWEILYRGAYHYLFDRKDFKRAAELLNKAGKAGAPSWVQSLAASLYTKEGQLGLAISSLESTRGPIKGSKQEKLLDERIEQLKKQARLLRKEKENAP